MSDSQLLRTVRKTLLKEMVKSVPGDWKVLIMDELTTKVMSASCRMSDILEEGVSLVEDLSKKRQPYPDMPAIYFISPTVRSIMSLCDDFKDVVQYHSANVFFSSKVSQADLVEIKRHPELVQRITALKEVGCEFLTVDSRTFVTDQPNALHDLFGEGSAGTPAYESAVNLAASRLTTLFTTLDEFPCIRYRSGKTPEGGPAGSEARALVSQRVAARLHSQLTELQRGGQVPQKETCDLVILDRSVDTVAPIIHEWTYEAMAYDLLPLNGDMYAYEAENRNGDKEKRDGLLEERDPLWVDLRHLFIADASLKLNNTLTLFRESNQAAKLAGGNGIADQRKLKGVVQSLGTYNQELSKLSLHIDIASNLNTMLREKALDEVGKLEQDLVFGSATSKEVIELLSKRQDLQWLDKVRILMTYVATHPEKLDSSKFKQWQKLANLKAEHMHTISNMEYLGVAVSKRSTKSSALSFGSKKKRQTRQARSTGDQEQWELSRFQPIVSEVMEDLAKDKLPESEYPYVVKPSGPAHGPRGTSSAGSARSKQSSVGWAKRTATAQSSDLNIDDIKLQGKRLIVFILGGVTRSEMRSSFTLSKQVGREIIIGSTSVETPKSYVKKVYELAELSGSADAQ